MAEALLILSDERFLVSSGTYYPEKIRTAVAEARERLEQTQVDWRSIAIEARYARISAIQEAVTTETRIEQENFHSYDSMRIRHMPKVESIIMPAGGAVWGGIGEPTICVAAPAVMNAFFRATGKRVRSVPLKNLDIHPA